MSDQPPGLTLLGLGLRLVSDQVKSWEWESLPQRELRRARERLGPLKSWQSIRRDK